MAKLKHDTAYLAITYWKLLWHKWRQYFKCSSDRRLRYRDL